MNSQCLPFSQIPHTTKLFSDYISDFRKLQPFYSASPYENHWLRAGTQYERSRRLQVADILERQNRQWGASSKTLSNIARFREGASAVVTGQQVGLFGGTAFSLYKALSALRLAQQAQDSGVDAVPIFWLATTDHDLAEINHVSIPDAKGVLQKFVSTSSGVANAPVGSVVLGSEIEGLVNAAVELLGETDITAALRESYRPGVELGDAYGRLFSHLFEDWGLILLDAADPALHAVAKPIYRAAIEQAEKLDEALLARGRELEKAGYHQQVKVTAASTLLFALHDGERTPIHRKANGGGDPEFTLGSERVTREELLQRIDSTPQEFSANVLLRPVVQDYLLPTLAYVGGAAEVAYFAQVDVVYRALLGKATAIIPRFSASLVEPKIARLLEKYTLNFSDLFHGPERLREIIATKTLPRDLQQAIDGANETVEKSMAAVKVQLAQLDSTLVESASRAESKMHYQLQRLRARAARAELIRNEVLTRHAERLSNALYPEKALQEREVAGIYFLGRYGKELLNQLYENIHTDCLDHQVITV